MWRFAYFLAFLEYFQLKHVSSVILGQCLITFIIFQFEKVHNYLQTIKGISFLFLIKKKLLFCCQLISCIVVKNISEIRILLEHLNDENWQIWEKTVTILSFLRFLKYFEHENKFLLSNCVWSLNFVVFRILHQKILTLLFFLLNRQCYFFNYISVTILSFFEQSTFSER